MKKVPVWKGSDIGHGSRGGVLSVGAHDIKIGQEVPISLLSKEAVKSLRDKGAIVDDVPDKQKEAPKEPESTETVNDAGLANAKKLVKAKKAMLTTVKKSASASKNTLVSAEKAVKNQQIILDKMADGDESKNKTEDVLQELMSGVETSQANLKHAEVVVEQAESALENAEKLLADLND